ncbi:MAG: sugar transferase [Ruminococcaceae bacterium]|nr:sugar transferase [Oscillospiraceae bacterium]
MYARFVKRALDVLFSIILLLLLAFPMLIIAVFIRADSEGKAIFKQRRRGREGKVFVCYKFRTMYCNAPPYTPASDFDGYERYVTRTGRFLRRTSLDELPQLFNVLRGEMSLVGPRPLICEEKDMHRLRMSAGVYRLRPGITGMAQVRGRNLLDDAEKIKNDSYYLSNLRMGLDLKILFITLLKVIKKEGIKTE